MRVLSSRILVNKIVGEVACIELDDVGRIEIVGEVFSIEDERVASNEVDIKFENV